MKIALCATHLFNMTLPQDRDYIGVDHGVEELLKQGITPRFAIGDFDSLQNRKSLEDLNIQILPEKKDVTDTHAAIEYAISKGYDECAGVETRIINNDNSENLIAFINSDYVTNELKINKVIDSTLVLLPSQHYNFNIKNMTTVCHISFFLYKSAFIIYFHLIYFFYQNISYSCRFNYL